MTIERLLQEEMRSCSCPDVKLEETGLGSRTGTLKSHTWHLSRMQASDCVCEKGDKEADLTGPPSLNRQGTWLGVEGFVGTRGRLEPVWAGSPDFVGFLQRTGVMVKRRGVCVSYTRLT